MLADGLGGVMLFTNTLVGVFALVVAICIEIPIAERIWRRGLAGTGRWIVLANIISASVGLFYYLFSHMIAGPLVGADPWQVYQDFWYNYLLFAGGQFAVTYVSEFLVYRGLNWFGGKKLSLRKLLSGTLITNLASYAVLILIGWVVAPNGGDFELRQDTNWVKTSDQRVYFVDQDTRQLCSVDLDGSDRKTEVSARLARIGWYFEQVSVYALLPDHQAILYYDSDKKWRTEGPGVERNIVVENGEVQFPMRESIWPPLHEVIVKAGISSGEIGKAEYSAYLPDAGSWRRVTAQGKRFKVETSLLTNAGIDGWGISVKEEGKPPLNFGVQDRILKLPCRDPVILDKDNLVLFRCGAWIMLLDPETKKVGRLVRGDSIVLMIDDYAKQY